MLLAPGPGAKYERPSTNRKAIPASNSQQRPDWLKGRFRKRISPKLSQDLPYNVPSLLRPIPTNDTQMERSGVLGVTEWKDRFLPSGKQVGLAGAGQRQVHLPLQ